MTRQEEIKKQADIYTDNASNYTEWSDDGGWSCTNDIELVEKAFIEGAQWADKNPKSPWISVDDDLPCNHEEFTHSNYTDRVLISARNGFVEVAFMSKIENVWVWETPIKVSHWMPIPKLPKE